VSSDRETRHRTHDERHVTTEAKDTVALTVGELREFLGQCTDAEVPDSVSVTVGGLSLRGEIVGTKSWWPTRISTIAYRKASE